MLIDAAILAPIGLFVDLFHYHVNFLAIRSVTVENKLRTTTRVSAIYGAIFRSIDYAVWVLVVETLSKLWNNIFIAFVLSWDDL